MVLKFRLALAFIPVIAAGAGLSGRAIASDFTFEAGLGYDLLSQDYFLDSVIVGPDSAIVDWTLTNRYLDDLRGRFGVSYSPGDNDRLLLRGRFEQTADFLRVRLGGNLDSKWSTRRLQCFGEVEIKERYRGEADFGDSYVRGYARGRLSQPLNQTLTLSLQMKGDGVRFASASDYNYNHFRLGGDIGLQKTFGDFSYADLRLLIDRRRVPDSVDLDYLRVGAEATMLAFYSHGELDLTAGVTRKDYHLSGHRDDHYRLVWEAENRLRLGRGWFSRQQITTDIVLYHPDDPVNTDYSEVGLLLLGGFESGPLSLAAGPVWERLEERGSEFDIGEDYTETAGRAVLDLIDPGRFFASIESTLGLRNIEMESDLQTDFVFERLSLIGDCSLTTALRLSLLFSAEWEWHDLTEENSRMILLSSSLTYQF